MIAEFDLPTPTKDAIEHSKQLVESMIVSTKTNPLKLLSFASFMQQSLYSPQQGYYSNTLPKIGSKGDFVTAPEISSLFSKCLARQAKQVLETLESANIVEFGAGKGTMARDILLELAELNQPVDNYYIIELSANLKQIQQQTIATLPEKLQNKVVWLNSLPPPLSAVVLANEVLDAMPVERLSFKPKSTSQAFVDIKDDGITWNYQAILDPKLQEKADDILNYIGKPSLAGYETEVNLNIEPWIASISEFLTAGMLLIVDYGYSRQEYYQPARVMGTLRCHYQHLAHNDPFFYPGIQDITAHVDFTAVAEAGDFAGFDIDGFTTQAHFLMASGLLEMSTEFANGTTDAIKISQQIKTLTMPNEMGETFKVIALTKQFEQPLIGFQLQNLLHTL